MMFEAPQGSTSTVVGRGPDRPATDLCDTGAFLQRWFNRLAETGWSSSVFLDALSDDLVWTATGSSPVSGVFRGKAAYVDGVFRRLDERLAAWPVPSVERVVASGDWGVVEFSSTGGLGHNGTDYSMRYCWVIHRSGARIDEVIGYFDTAKVVELFS